MRRQIALIILFFASTACAEKNPKVAERDDKVVTKAIDSDSQAPSRKATAPEPEPKIVAADPASIAELNVAYDKLLQNQNPALTEFDDLCKKGLAKACMLAFYKVSEKQDASGRAVDPRAISYAKSACELGDGGGCYSAAMQERDETASRTLLAKGCDIGGGSCCMQLGDIVSGVTGSVESADWKAAATFYERGCDGDSMESCAKFAELLRDGKGVAKDAARATSLFESACEDDVRWACGES